MTDIITKRAITYSVLAHIKNSGGLLAEGPLDVFIPLVKKSLHYFNTEKNQYKGENISEIRTIIEEQYGIDFPLPVLKSILQKLAKEINSDEEKVFELYQDGAFWIKDYVFEDYDEQLKASKLKIQELQKAFKEFCKINNVSDIDENCIIQFIEKNKHSISRYLAHKTIPNEENFTIPALFIDYFRNSPNFYSQIRDLYLGSTLTCSLEYKFVNTKIEVTLLLDTNFIISLIDLNTPESTHTCRKLLEVCENIGYKFVILPETLEEIKNLINFKSNNYDKVVISKYVNKEDIFNACERRKLSKVDLDRICDNLETTLEEYTIFIIANTTSLKNKAKYSNEYKLLKQYRNTERAALHDAMAIIYVKEKRNKKIREFERVNSWFVNNSITHDINNEGIDAIINSDNSQYQPEIIKADNLLNILWLSNPNINTSLANNELVDMGLTSLVAFALNESLPKARIIKELDDNIQKYKSQDITDKDVYLLSSRIVSTQLKNIELLNELAKKNVEEFNLRIKDEAKKQEEIETDRAARFEDLFKKQEKAISNISMEKEEMEKQLKFEKQKEIEKIKSEMKNEIQRKSAELQEKDIEIARLKKENIERINNIRGKEREIFITIALKKWRRKSWIWLYIVGLLLVGSIIGIVIICNGNLLETNKFISASLQNKIVVIILSIAETIIVKSLYDKYQNHSNIKSYKESLNIPDELKNILDE
jgi:predicted nucleic acid-binding protein